MTRHELIRQFRSREARVAWVAFALVIVTVVAVAPHRTVVPDYRHASLMWWQGGPIYAAGSTGFVYLPQSALLFAPFAGLPVLASEIAWRLLTIGSFAFGVWRFAGLAGRAGGTDLFPLASLVVIPLSWSSARNGQMTLPMAACMMLAVAQVGERRWWQATASLTLAVALKPIAIVLVLLTGALHVRTMAWRLLVGLTFMLLLPFATQAPAYVVEQYTAAVTHLGAAASHGAGVPYAHLFGMLAVFGVNVSEGVQSAWRVVAAVGTLGLCVAAQRRFPAAQAEVMTFALAACYLMLFNPRTENNTYALLAPAVGIYFARSLLVAAQGWRPVLLSVIALGIVGSYEFGRMFTAPARSVWLAPLMGVAFGVFLCREIVRPARP